MTEEPVDVAYGQAIRLARKAKGIRTQQELGDLIDRSGKMVQHYEHGRHLTPEVRALLESKLDIQAVAGDPVEVALDRSELADWRASDVKTLYKRHLHDQRREGATG